MTPAVCIYARGADLSSSHVLRLSRYSSRVNRMRTLPIFLLILVALSTSMLGQQPKAEKVDEFGAVGCDDFLARADGFLVQLNNDPGAVGYFVLHGESKLLKGKLFWEEQMSHAMAFRRPTAPVKIVRAPERGDFRAEMWLVPPGAKVPDFEETTWDFHVAKGTKPFMLTSEVNEMCDFPARPTLINDYLNANPQMYLKVVIYASTQRQRQQTIAKTVEDLKSVSAARIRFRYKRLPRDYADARREYYLVP